MQILITIFYIWLVVTLFALALLGVMKARYNAQLRRQARWQDWDYKMLRTEWGQEIMAARENFRLNPPAPLDDTPSERRRKRRLERRWERQSRYRGPIVVFSHTTWSWLVPVWRQCAC
jgi:hypothetical protein